MLHDGAGLYLQVSQGANDTVNKSWLYRYSIAGRSRQIGLGSYPTLSLSQARKAAEIQRGIRAVGKDPLLEKRAARERFWSRSPRSNLRRRRRRRRSTSAPTSTSPPMRPSGRTGSPNRLGAARCGPTLHP